MRKMAMLVVILTAISALRAQDKSQKQNGFKAGLTYSGFGTNDVYRFNELDGAAAIDGDSFYSIGLTFIQPLNYWLNFEEGLWKSLSTEKLIVPLDIHMTNICKILGFTTSKTNSMSNALKITKAFAALDPKDPVKWDFALSRLGIHPDLNYKELIELF